MTNLPNDGFGFSDNSTYRNRALLAIKMPYAICHYSLTYFYVNYLIAIMQIELPIVF